jgi:hypothetical protein
VSAVQRCGRIARTFLLENEMNLCVAFSKYTVAFAPKQAVQTTVHPSNTKGGREGPNVDTADTNP